MFQIILRLALLATATLFIVTGCASLGSQQPEATRVKLEGRPALYVWPNRNSHSNNEATLHLAVRVGSLQERDDERGFAHFVEHMAFNGTDEFPRGSLQQRLKDLGLEIGAHSNAYTTFDHTLYTLNLDSVDPERLEAAMELLSQWASHIEFDSGEVDQERSVILEEWRQSRPEPGRVSVQFEENYYAGSRHLNRLPIGQKATIETASSDALSRFYDRWYQPANMAVIVAGDIDERAVQRLFEHYFPKQAIQSNAQPDEHQVNPNAMPDYLAATDAYTGSGYVDLTFFSHVQAVETEQNLIDQLAMEAALDIWHQRAESTLVETQGAVDWVDYEWEYLDSDFLQLRLSAGLSGSDLQTGLTVLEQQRVDIVSHGVTQTELDNWRQGVLDHERSQQDSASHLADEALDHYLMDWPMVGQERWITLLEQSLPSLSPKAVQSALSEIMSSQPKVRVVHPQSQRAPTEADVSAWLSSVQPSAEAASGSSAIEQWSIQPEREGRITATQTHPNGVTEWTLDNGMTVLYRHSDQTPDKVYYAMSGTGGLNSLPTDDILSARLALPTLGSSGLRDMSGTELNEWLTSHAMEQHPHYSFFSRGMRGAGPAKRFPVMMRLLHIALTEGRVDPAVWTHIRTQNRSYLTQQNEHPHRPWSRAAETLIYQDDPALRSMTHSELDSITPERMQAVYERYFAGAQNYRLAVVGDVDRETVEQAIVTSVASLPQSEQSDDTCDCRMYPSPTESATRHIEGSGEQEATMVLRYSVDKSSIPLDTTYPLAFVQKWIQSELMDELREKQGLVYSVNVQLDGYSVFQDEYTLIIATSTDPKQVDTLVSATESALKTLSSNPPEAPRVQKWQRGLIDETDQRLNSAKAQSIALVNAPILGQSIEMALETGERREAPTPDRLARLLQPFMDENAIRLELAWLP